MTTNTSLDLMAKRISHEKKMQYMERLNNMVMRHSDKETDEFLKEYCKKHGEEYCIELPTVEK